MATNKEVRLRQTRERGGRGVGDEEKEGASWKGSKD